MSKKFDEAVYRFCTTIFTDLEYGEDDVLGKELEKMQNILRKSKAFTPPTPEEVLIAGKEMGFKVDAQEFCDFYGAKNWMIGKNKMKNWKMALGRACRDGWCIKKKTPEDYFQESLPDADDPILDEVFGKVAG